MDDTRDGDREPRFAGERLVTQFTPAQRGWMVTALVVFVGVAFVGPALTATARSGRRIGAEAGRRMRRLGGRRI